MTTSIEWTTETWNPTVGCSRVSAGCENCYAERVAHRGMQDAHKGLTVMGKKGPRWNGEVRLLPERLATPLRWRKPRKVFVDSMSDLFHEGVPFEYVAAVYGVIAACRQHTFQVLTKRPERALMFDRWLDGHKDHRVVTCLRYAAELLPANTLPDNFKASLGNLWLGVSIEDQATADARIPVLLTLPAAVRWVSYEPALGPVVFQDEVGVSHPIHQGSPMDGLRAYLRPSKHARREYRRRLDWVVVGGESGPGARPFDLAWARSTVEQCRAAGVPVFVKQLGAVPQIRDACRGDGSTGDITEVTSLSCGHSISDRVATLLLRSRKGADTSEWPPDLRVQEFPEARP